MCSLSWGRRLWSETGLVMNHISSSCGVRASLWSVHEGKASPQYCSLVYIGYFSCRYDQTPEEGNLRKEGYILAPSLRGYSQSWQ